MAAFIPAAKTVRIQWLFTNADGTSASTRAFFNYTGAAPIAADLIVLATGAYDAAVTEWGPLLHETWTLAECIAVDLSSDLGPEGVYGATTVGSLAGGKLPASAAALLSMHTARRYRGGHSRLYTPLGDDTKLQTDTAWTDAFVSACQDAWTTIQASVYFNIWAAGGDFTQVMASFYSGFTNVPYGTPTKYRRVPTGRATAALYPVLNYTAQKNIATQRRRLLPA